MAPAICDELAVFADIPVSSDTRIGWLGSVLAAIGVCRCPFRKSFLLEVENLLFELRALQG